MTIDTQYLDADGDKIKLARPALLDMAQRINNLQTFSVTSIANLRLIDKTKASRAIVLGYYSAGDGGGGIYWHDAGDTTSADNGGTIIVGVDGGRWKLSQQFNLSVKQFGARGNGTDDDTDAITKAYGAMSAGGRLYYPAGTYIDSADHQAPVGAVVYGDGAKTVIKRKASSVNTAMLVASTDCEIRDLVIDGNGSVQATVCYGILGYRVQRAKISNVWAKDCYGIGIGWSDSEKCVCYQSKVSGGLSNSAGFWNDTYSTDSFYANGGHRYIECEAIDNQLDGINIATPKNVIIGGNYSHNGYGGSYGGALGAAGIFTLDSEVQSTLTVIGATCNDNTEFGINVAASNCVITGCICNNNQLAGIFVKNGKRTIIDGNVCAYNGWYAGSSNPTLWRRGGILFYPDAQYLTITNNSCYDDRGGSATQEYGIVFASSASATVCNGITMSGNTCRSNKLDNDNINPAKAAFRYANLAGLDYDDFTSGENCVLETSSTTPSVAGGVRLVNATGPVTITDFTGGTDSQIITVAVVSGVVTITDGGNISLVGTGNVALSNYMSSITLVRRGGIWFEMCRAIF